MTAVSVPPHTTVLHNRRVKETQGGPARRDNATTAASQLRAALRSTTETTHSTNMHQFGQHTSRASSHSLLSARALEHKADLDAWRSPQVTANANTDVQRPSYDKLARKCGSLRRVPPLRGTKLQMRRCRWTRLPETRPVWIQLWQSLSAPVINFTTCSLHTVACEPHATATPRSQSPAVSRNRASSPSAQCQHARPVPPLHRHPSDQSHATALTAARTRAPARPATWTEAAPPSAWTHIPRCPTRPPRRRCRRCVQSAAAAGLARGGEATLCPPPPR